MALSFDPQQLATLSTDTHLPAVPAQRLTPEALRTRFQNPPVWTPEMSNEHIVVDRAPAHAAVLVGLVQRDELTVLLTQRTAHLHDHPGQISFAGGRCEPEDVDAVATALREAQEEVGVAPEKVDVLGQLPPYITGTGFIVTPVIGLVDPSFEVNPDPFEVDEVFEVPLAFLMDPANHRWHEATFGDRRRVFLSMPWTGVGSHGNSRRYFVWGATAAMLRNLYGFLRA